jgi:hypothetical protein
MKYFYVICSALILLFFYVCGRTPECENSRPRVLKRARSTIDTSSSSRTFTDADYKDHVKELKKKVPEGFTIVVQKPFVVIGNESPEIVKKRAEKTIKWAVDKVKQKYFEKDPDVIIDIWLFKDEKSYYKYAKEIFGDEPTTPFGYFLEREHVLIMNISTGGGTLVHEIVHPFMHANFPECPPWFDEGLASLYEQCGEKDGHIYGFTNWRLKGLQEAIEQDLVPSFKVLTAMNANEFYLQDKGTNYSQARYLCFYLQERGLLVKYYREFYKHRRKDPTGYNTLKNILKEDDMAAFKGRWGKFVLSLAYP